MIKIREQKDWKIVKIGGQYYVISLDEQKRLWGLEKQYRGLEKAPDAEMFTAYVLAEDNDGIYSCNGKSSVKRKINELEFFLLEVVG